MNHMVDLQQKSQTLWKEELYVDYGQLCTKLINCIT